MLLEWRVVVVAVGLKMDRKEMIVLVQAEATSAGANTVGIVEIRSKEVNRSVCWKLGVQ